MLVGNLDHFDTSSDRAHNLAEVTADTFRLIHVRHAGKARLITSKCMDFHRVIVRHAGK